ncbi:hypothetical protein BsWGS_09044 [Bradybaena similaris]
MFRKINAEEYSANVERQDALTNLYDFGTISQLLRHPQHGQALGELKAVLLREPCLGINKVSGTLSLAGLRGYDQNIPGNVYHRNRRSVVGDNDTTDEAIYSTTAHSTNAHQVTEAVDNTTTVSSRRPLLSTSAQPQLTTSSAQVSRCDNHTQQIFTSLMNQEQWALQFIDSWGKPGPGLLNLQLKFVGSYQECRSSRSPPSNTTPSDAFTGNYCAVKLAISAGIGSNSLIALMSSTSPEIGSCLPSSCSSGDVFSLISRGLAASNLSSTLIVTSVDCRSDYREYTAATIVAIILLSIIAILMVLGTVTDVVLVQYPKWAEAREKTLRSSKQANGYHILDDDEVNVGSDLIRKDEKSVLANGAGHHTDDKPGVGLSLYSEGRPLLGKKKHGFTQTLRSGKLGKCLMAFSVYTNGSKLLNTTQQSDSLGAIFGIRFLSMSWVILGHMFSFSLGYVGNIASSVTVFLGRWTFDGISNALVSVDTFFALSGLLTAYLTTKAIQKKKGWKINWAMYYFHRFWRLTPPYMLVLLCALGLQRFFGSGAMWSSVQPADKVSCEKNWWTNLLYLNNLVNARQMCMAHSWYMANDMQFYILAPLMIVPFYFNVFAGLGSCLIFLLASWITTGVLSTNNEWPNSLINGVALPPGKLDYQTHYYFAPYCRIGPFVIGIMAGYLLAVTKGHIHMKWFHVLAGWVLAIAVGLACVYGIHGDITQENVSTVPMAAFYNAVARSAWGACVCWVVVACVTGYGGPVNALLSWSPFVFLGRLTYMSYLIHPTVIYVYAQNLDQMYYLNDTNMVISFLGVFMFTSLVSFVLVLGFESPMIGLEKVFLPRH